MELSFKLTGFEIVQDVGLDRETHDMQPRHLHHFQSHQFRLRSLAKRQLVVECAGLVDPEPQEPFSPALEGGARRWLEDKWGRAQLSIPKAPVSEFPAEDPTVRVDSEIDVFLVEELVVAGGHARDGGLGDIRPECYRELFQGTASRLQLARHGLMLRREVDVEGPAAIREGIHPSHAAAHAASTSILWGEHGVENVTSRSADKERMRIWVSVLQNSKGSHKMVVCLKKFHVFFRELTWVG